MLSAEEIFVTKTICGALYNPLRNKVIRFIRIRVRPDQFATIIAQKNLVA